MQLGSCKHTNRFVYFGNISITENHERDMLDVQESHVGRPTNWAMAIPLWVDNKKVYH